LPLDYTVNKRWEILGFRKRLKLLISCHAHIKVYVSGKDSALKNFIIIHQHFVTHENMEQNKTEQRKRKANHVNGDTVMQEY